MPLFPFRVNIFKLQEQDVMKKFTACTFPQDIIASSIWSAIHKHAHTHAQTQTHRIDRGTRDWLRCSPKHVRSLVWKKEEEWINQPASRKGKADSAVLSMYCCPQHVLRGPHGSYHRTAEKLESSLLKLAPGRNEAIRSCLAFTLTSRAPSSHHHFLVLWFQRACIVLLHVHL